MAVLPRFKPVESRHGLVGEPGGLMGLGNQTLSGNAGVFTGTGALSPQALDCQRALPPTRND